MVVYVPQNNLSSRSADSSWWNIILIMATSQEWLKLVLERILLKICRVSVYEFPIEITMILRGISIWFEQWLIFTQISQSCSSWNRMPSSCEKIGVNKGSVRRYGDVSRLGIPGTFAWNVVNVGWNHCEFLGNQHFQTQALDLMGFPGFLLLSWMAFIKKS